ncbi:class III lanthionine synthetase LanKC [Streptomyces sp. ACA25]|uniref:class III lanthionine synthetase LanKC n=1 Tax=Streptomyces sp. ACA25 TaxID=3022596 RepID=UPI0023072063|nr:class III lanthionine synthetase LanKC [Streptomyces sp. ACA25]MDB1087786.1 class III lanthionine synthetase LanKC [Streptomyces sp. ACA25]
MDKRYEAFCLADRHFYETPDRWSSGGNGKAGTEGLFETAERPLPENWTGVRSGDWLQIRPDRSDLPQQGWKIHVSATLDNADRIAAVIRDYCIPRGIPFKFVPSRHLLYLRNSKYAGRDSSGKFATVYPAGEEQLRSALTDLDASLAGEPGPYILTDLRWRDGPLYVRYGAFARRTCADEAGRLVPAIENAEGRLVPDRRAPTFALPDWVTLPDFLAPQLAARNSTTTQDLPYRIERALHFSNGGGVYSGTDTRTGEQVVLKEARPHAGLAADGVDAVSRLEREKAVLERLAGLSVVPAARDWFTLGGHQFLVMDHLPGRTLNSFFAERHPLISEQPEPAALADYTDWALHIHREVEEAVGALHERGVVFNDLHMFNIMVAPDEKSVALLDFEAASYPGNETRQIVAHPGFLAPADRSGPDIDRYALACLRLALFLPMTSLFSIDRGKAAHLAALVAQQFPDVPQAFLDEAVAVIEGPAVPGSAARSPAVPVEPGDWPRSRDAMARAILASATPDREDRLFPGDIAQFSEGGGLGLAHGAAGVLYALAETGAERYEEGERWLLRQAAAPPQGTPVGLYDGLLGVACVLDRLGHTERALDLSEQLPLEGWQHLPPDLFGGLAGIGLAFERLAAAGGGSELHDLALEAAERAAARLSPEPGPPQADRAGLLRGATGPALLFLRLYERTGDPALLDLAGTALRQDLARCRADRRGTWLVDEGNRLMPYIGAGSTGIGMVLDDYLAHRPDEELEQARAAILPAARSRFYAQPGLFRGRAGMVLHLSRTTAPAATAEDLAAQIDGLAWYALPYGGGLAFPGDQMMRLSMDLATGTAGCLLALGAARHTDPVQLPFLPPLRHPEPPR